jgi:RecA/RadA recombinase
MSALRDKLIKNTKLKYTSVLSDSQILKDNTMIDIGIPGVNLALSAELDGGLTSGVTVIAGPSRHFKSGFALLMVAAFLRKYQDGIVLFFDSEFGMPEAYFNTFQIDRDKIIHIPITDIEQLKFELVSQLNAIERGEHIMIVVDSIGNLSSKKESEDAAKGSGAADMTRAKELKSFYRIITPHLKLKNIPFIGINHTYKTMELYSKDIISGGCVVKDTEIQTVNGLVKIQDLIEGDVIITNYGNNSISHVWTPETLDNGYPECYEIEFEDGHTIICSETHKFLINGKWIEAKDIVTGMDCQTI